MIYGSGVPSIIMQYSAVKLIYSVNWPHPLAIYNKSVVFFKEPDLGDKESMNIGSVQFELPKVQCAVVSVVCNAVGSAA